MSAYFEHKGIIFREILESDLPFIQALRNDFTTWRELGDPRPLKAGLQRKWLESLNSSQDRIYFIASGMEEGPIGLIRMDEIDLVNRSIRVGTDVLPSLRGKGWGTKIFEAIEKYVFHYLGMHRAWLLVLESNLRAKALYSKIGFTIEGVMKEAIYRDGKWQGYIIMSLLENDYERKPGNGK